MSKNIENILRQMPLREPSPDLDERILSPRPSRLWWAASITAAAAGLLLVLMLAQSLPDPGELPPIAQDEEPGEPPTIAEAPQKPTRFVETISGVDYAGTINKNDTPPIRAYRTRAVRKHSWTDRETGARVQMVEPHEQIILVTATMD